MSVINRKRQIIRLRHKPLTADEIVSSERYFIMRMQYSDEEWRTFILLGAIFYIDVSLTKNES